MPSTQDDAEASKSNIHLQVPWMSWLSWSFNWIKFEQEFVWSKIWTERSWKSIFIGFSLALLRLSPGSVDLVSDYLSAYVLINGTEYIKVR